MELAPGLYLGRRAFERELPEEATLVVDMTAEFPKPAYSSRREYVCLPTLLLERLAPVLAPDITAS
ncbi:MAG: hypothetical protein HY922_10960 [Elusimicrobia bacterium]|nr:hypothetical protein [Elusimicrobiota bacterium]